MTNSKILEVNQLQTHFFTEEGVVRAVDGVSFDLYAGETLGIVGESGSGKSVCSLSIMRLIPDPPGRVVGGSIHHYDKDGQMTDLLALPESEMRRYRGKEIAMIFQEPMTSLNPVMRCGEQVMEAILLHLKLDKTAARQRTLELFAQVQLPEPERIFRAYPHQLSGGQKQRVMIAMALSCNPRILIADEPTTALDVTVQKSILDLTSNLKKMYNASVIFITHDLGVIYEIADRVLVMYKGKIVEQGAVKDIFNDPQHPYTKGLLACRPPLDRRVHQLPVIDDFMERQINADGQMQLIEKPGSIRKKLDQFIVEPATFQQRQKELQQRSPLLQVKDLSVWYPVEKNFLGQTKRYLRAVDEVSFQVYPGETLGLVGESGCGKTTLGRAILRLTEARSGEVVFEGTDLLSLTEKEMKRRRREMQIIFQDPYSSLNPRRTVGQAILEPLQVHRMQADEKARRQRVYELLEQVGMESRHYDRYPHEFSGGQRQRICIARALALEPRFIVCDESVSALDVSVQAQVLNLLMDLREQLNLTYIFISHDLSVVKLMSDRIAVMQAGKIVELGNAEQVYHHPQNDYTRSLIEAIPRVDITHSNG